MIDILNRAINGLLDPLGTSLLGGVIIILVALIVVNLLFVGYRYVKKAVVR